MGVYEEMRHLGGCASFVRKEDLDETDAQRMGQDVEPLGSSAIDCPPCVCLRMGKERSAR